MTNALVLLLEQMIDKEDKAVMALSQARRELDEYYQQISQIEQYRLDYCNQLVERGMSGLTASEYGHLNRFLTQLDATLDKQKEAESQFKQQVETSEEHWHEVRKQRRSYEWMLDKKRVERERLASIREQKELDEFTTLQFARRKGAQT
ncbi:flagellar export protein FliJ [Vibrio sp. WJH972]